MQALDRSETDGELDVRVDWTPAYELYVSFIAFTLRDKHTLDELGPDWLPNVRRALPPDFAASKLFRPKQDDALLMRLILGAPPSARGSADAWLDWYVGLSAGAAYEALAPVTPADEAPQLPRDFVAWRDRLASMLRTWSTSIFAHVEPTLLEALRHEAAALSKRLEACPPAQRRTLVADVTNGIWIEADSGVDRVVLVPQFHQRPYNEDNSIAGGILLLYPADSAARPADGPPLGLLRLTQGLADESRLKILRFLATEGSKSLTDVAHFAGLSQPTVHHHLARLRVAGLVRVHVTGAHNRRYSLRPNAVSQLTSQLGQYLEVSA